MRTNPALMVRHEQAELDPGVMIGMGVRLDYTGHTALVVAALHSAWRSGRFLKLNRIACLHNCRRIIVRSLNA